MEEREAPGTATEVDEADVTEEMIERRAYEISQSGEGGTPEQNWWRAADELRRGAAREFEPGRRQGRGGSSGS